MRGLVALALIVTACAGSGTTPTTSSDPVTTSVGSATTATTQPNGATSTTASLDDGEVRPHAPDFTLELGEGGTYTLSTSTRPVYLVFWAEWCPVCRQELPMVDRISADYADLIDFVAPAWKSGEQATIEAAAELFPSGHMQWGLDPDEIVFELYGVPYQPVTVLIGADKTVVEAWAGVRPESEIRASLDALITVTP